MYKKTAIQYRGRLFWSDVPILCGNYAAGRRSASYPAWSIAGRHSSAAATCESFIINVFLLLLIWNLTYCLNYKFGIGYRVHMLVIIGRDWMVDVWSCEPRTRSRSNCCRVLFSHLLTFLAPIPFRSAGFCTSSRLPRPDHSRILFCWWVRLIMNYIWSSNSEPVLLNNLFCLIVLDNSLVYIAFW